MRFQQKGAADPSAALQQLRERVLDSTEEGVQFFALSLVRQTKVELSTPGKGRLYGAARRKRDAQGRFLRSSRGRRKAHRASAPGDPPAVDTGQLRNSVDMEPIPGRRPRARGVRSITIRGFRVGSGDERAPWLEFGTMGPQYTGGRIAPRPFLRPAASKTIRAVNAQVVAAMRRAGRGGRTP